MQRVTGSGASTAAESPSLRGHAAPLQDVTLFTPPSGDAVSLLFNLQVG